MNTSSPRNTQKQMARRFGYVLAIAINIALIVIANNLLDWGWFSFLTEDFRDVLWLLNLSFGLGILTNLAFLINDSRRPKALGQLVTNTVSVIATVRVLQVFPFDFSAWDTDWAWLFRTTLIVGIVGATIGAISELVKLFLPAAERKAPSTASRPSAEREGFEPSREL